MFIDHWSFQTLEGATTLVLPDGCQDLICTLVEPGKPTWRISPFYTQASQVQATDTGRVEGFRLAPGTQLNHAALLKSLQNCEPDPVAVTELILRHTWRTDAIEQILECLAHGHNSVSLAARELGVHPRTLQRQFSQRALQTPKYWLDLARIRHAARRIAQAENLADIAAVLNYADQAHLTRDCRHWLGVTPTQLRQREDLTGQLSGIAYA